MRNHWRAYLTLFVLIALGFSIGARLLFLQVLNAGFYKALAQGQQGASMVEKGERGKIFARDKTGNLVLLAANQKVPYAFLSPAEILSENEEQVATLLSPLLTIDQNVILQKTKNKESFFEVLKKKMTEEEAKAMEALTLEGAHIGWEISRVYPQGSFASHLLGFVNHEGKGQYGVEGFFDDVLAGKEGVRRNILNPASYFLGAGESSAENGKNIILTIDYNIQSLAEALLKRAQENLGAKEGTIIVINPRTGKILALANTPSFNPNEYAKEKLETFPNAAVEKIYEPGSVFKAITMASALEEHAVEPTTTYVDEGILRIGGDKIHNYDNTAGGERTMREVLEFSINTGAVFAATELGHSIFMKFLYKFGIFEKTNVSLPGEVASQNRELRQGYNITLATASFGQGIEMTPMQLVRAYSALANKGRLVTPFIIEGETPELSQPILSPQTVLDITSMLVSVTEEGFGKAARVPGYAIAGKTGTAQVSWSALGVQKAGYSDQTVQSFIGYAPAYNPQMLVLVKLTNPKTKTAEYSAVPLFKEIMKYSLDYVEIPPDTEQ